MRSGRHEHALAVTIALLLTAGGAWASPESTGSIPQTIEAVSEPLKIDPTAPSAPANVVSPAAPEAITPITASVAPAAEKSDADLNARIPLPAPLDFPPPSAKDLAAPVPTPEQPVAPAAVQTPPAAKDTATAPTPPPTGKDAPLAATLAEADIPVAEKLRELATGKLDRFIDRKKDRTAVEAFYAARQYAPLWIEKGVATANAKAAVAYLAGVAAEGLDPADYPTPDFQASADPAALAQAEFKLTNSVLNFARHAQTGRVHFSRVSDAISYNQVFPEPADILTKMADTKDIPAALADYNPPQDGYKALKAKLAEARARTGDSGPARIANGPLLKIDKEKIAKNSKNKVAADILMQDPRVPALRTRLGVPGEPDNTTYDRTLADAVKKFQRQNDLSPNGNLNSATIEALNGPRRDRDANIIIANMERWRWLPRDLGKAYVMLNIPDYSLKVMNAGKTVWTTRVVTGKPGKMATPMLSETMKFITVNPTWNVPPSIINNEYLPVLQQDPNALERIGLKVIQNRDGSIHIYQPPGERNALGRIRFNFPNKFLVYQHDTPDKHLFAENKRAFSHGCMRVQNPDKYAEVLLSITQPKEGWTVERLHKMYGNNEQNINLAYHMPVHITYQTAFVDDAGQLQIRDDVYGRDAALLAILKGDERRVADVAIERRETTTTVRRDIALPQTAFSGGSPVYASGPSFFERLFGGAPAATPPAPVNKRRTYTR
jgi:murein L,D-transpeptidase YcbB/YkuD